MLYYIYKSDSSYVIDTDTFMTYGIEEAKALFHRKKITGYNSKAYIITAIRMDNYLLIIRNHTESGVTGINEELWVRGKCLFKVGHDKHIQNLIILANGDSIAELGKGYRWVVYPEYYYVNYNAKTNSYRREEYLSKVWKYIGKYKELDKRTELYKQYFGRDSYIKQEHITNQVRTQFQEDWFLTDIKPINTAEYILTLMNGYTGEIINIDGDELIHKPLNEEYIKKMHSMERLIRPIYLDKLTKKVRQLTYQIQYIYSYTKKDIVFQFGTYTNGWIHATLQPINLYIRQHCAEEIEWLRKKLGVAVVIPIYNHVPGTIDIGFASYYDIYSFYTKTRDYTVNASVRYRSLAKNGTIEY